LGESLSDSISGLAVREEKISEHKFIFVVGALDRIDTGLALA